MRRTNPSEAQKVRDALAVSYDLEAKNLETAADLGDANIKRNFNDPGAPAPALHIRRLAATARKRAATARRKVEN
jgi:hypothetical protein